MTDEEIKRAFRDYIWDSEQPNSSIINAEERAFSAGVKLATRNQPADPITEEGLIKIGFIKDHERLKDENERYRKALERIVETGVLLNPTNDAQEGWETVEMFQDIAEEALNQK